MIIEILIFVLTTLFAYYIFTYKRMHYFFEKHDIKYKRGIPVFGNFIKSTFLRNHFWEDIDDVYKSFPNERYVGIVEGTLPIILIRDLELVKNITVKDFDHFVDHRLFFGEDIDPLFGGSLFSMRGDKWRDMRMTLSPAFTGSKMRHMMPFMVDISHNFIEHLKGRLNEDVDVLEVIHRYANDVIASAAFGLEINSLKQKDNEFYTLGQGIFNFTAIQRFNMFLIAQFPSFAKKLNIKLFPDKTTNFFRNIVASTMEYREKNNVERPDMIQLLMEAKKGTLKHSGTVENDTVGFATVEESLKPQGSPLRKWTDDDLAAQVFIFFVAGFESSASVLVMACHELAINPDVQEQLFQEVKDFKSKHEDLTFDNINELKYLDCVMNETLRKWSPALVLDRVCQKPYELPPLKEGGTPFMLKPGDIVYNPVNSIHTDPEYYPNPLKFDPSRFSDENKHNIRPFSFLPFGSGPRNCIGSRFALLELKVLLYYLTLNFKIVKCAKTTEPIKLLPKDFNIRAIGGTWVRFQERN